MTFKAGDRVSVEGVVKYDQDLVAGDTSIFVEIDGQFKTIITEPDKVTLVQAKFSVGETVRADNGVEYCIGDIAAIHGDSAWIQTLGGYNGIFKLKHLDRMAPAPIAETPEA